MLTVREVMQKLSYEHPDAPVVVRMEKLHYDINGKLIPKLTEVESVAVSEVRPLLDGRVVIA